MVIDLLERLFWTFVAAFLGTLLGTPALIAVLEGVSGAVIDISAIQAAVVAATVAGLAAVANFLLVIARWRLSVLPNPGDGFTRSRPFPEDHPQRWARDDGQPHGDLSLPPPAV